MYPVLTRLLQEGFVLPLFVTCIGRNGSMICGRYDDLEATGLDFILRRRISRVRRFPYPSICSSWTSGARLDTYAVTARVDGRTWHDDLAYDGELRLKGVSDLMKIQVRVGPSRIAGQGLFAAQDIHKGTQIMQYIGEKISSRERAVRLVAGNAYIFHFTYRYPGLPGRGGRAPPGDLSDSS